MTQDEIEHMWKVASNDPNHDTNWHDPVVIAFARLLERRILSMDNPHLRIALDAAQDKARRDEREDCAELRNMFHPIDGHGRQEMIDAMNRGLDEYQAAIRARGQA
jgi:hypothetical protein